MIFVSIDTFAAGHSSLYGYGRRTTPRLEALAAEAVTFRRCKANAPYTLQSYMSQLTGLYPAAHTIQGAGRPEGVRDTHLIAWEHYRIADGRWTLAEALRAAGYRTAAFVDNPWLAPGFGFAQGFDHFDASAAAIHGLDPEGGVRHVLPRAREWLAERAPGEPFFVFLQFLDLHTPYMAREPWKSAFAGDGLVDAEHEAGVTPSKINLFDHVPWMAARGLYERARDMPERMRTAPLVDAYDAKVLEMDQHLGELFDHLRARGLYDEAVLIVSADHGESMLEHRYFFNHGLLYEECLHVPLIVRLPGGRHGGRVVEEPVQLVDLYPTVLELAGLDPDRAHLHGRSLAPALAGAPLEPRPILAEGGVQTQRSLELDGWKLVESYPGEGEFRVMLTHPRLGGRFQAEVVPELERLAAAAEERGEAFDLDAELKASLRRHLGGPVHELYHLPDDPTELRDRSAEEAGRVAALVEILHRERERALAAARAVESEGSADALSAEARAELERLGYF